MKKISLALLFLTQLSLMRYSNAQSLTVIEQDYNQALQLAQQQQKLLLVDFYTTWCGPCKLLDKLVFRDTAVGNSMARHFIVLRYNAEKDSVYQLTQKHHIGMYPSAVVLNNQQRIVLQQYGTGGADKDLVTNYTAFLHKATQLNNTGYFIPGIAASTQLPYPTFYTRYINRINTKSAEQQAMQYLDTLTSLLEEIPFKIFCYFGGGNERLNNYFLQHKNELQQLYGKTDVQFVTSMLISDKAFSALITVNRPRFDSAMHLAKTYQDGPESKRYIASMELRMLQAENKWDTAFALLEKMIQQGQATDDAITRFCQAATAKCNNQTVLKKSVRRIQALCKTNADYENLSTLAYLLFKTGNQQQAQVTMQQAIATGKKNNISTSKEEKWLQENGQ